MNTASKQYPQYLISKSLTMNTISKQYSQYLLQLKLLIMVNLYKMSQAQEEEEIEEIEDKEVFHEHSGGSSELNRLILICCLGASIFLLLFFCFKIYVENKIKNAPVEDLGPFGVTPPGALKTIAISDLTQDQRKAVLEVLYPDGTCAVFQKVSNHHLIKSKIGKFLIANRLTFIYIYCLLDFYYRARKLKLKKKFQMITL